MTGDLYGLVQGLPAYGRRPAVGLRGTYGARWWSYADLYRRTCGCAETLRDGGVVRGDRVLLWAANSPEWVCVALGAVLAGAVVVPVDAGASAPQVRRLVEHVRPAVVVTDVPADTDRPTDTDWPADTDGPGVRRIPIAALAAAAPDRPDPPGTDGFAPPAPEDPAFLLYSSGSSGISHGVVLTHGNLASQTAVFRRWRRLTRWLPVRLLALSPLSHSQGLVVGLTVPLALGISVLYSGSVDPDHVGRAIRDNRINILLAVPGVQRLLADRLRHGRRRAQDPTLADRTVRIRWFPLRRHVLFLATRARLGLRFVMLMIGGAPLPRDDERFWYECGYVVVHGYGLTETSALVSVKVNGPFFARLHSIGRPLPNQEVRLEPDGQVLVRGPNVAPGLPDGDGFLRTGDLARWDRRHRLVLRGRADNVIVTSNGTNVVAEEVESVLRSVPGVRDAVVTARRNGALTEVHAVLLLANQRDPASAVGEANRRLETHERVHNWTVWPEADFPRTALLKVRRAEVEAAVTPAAPLTPAHPPSLADVRTVGDRRQRLELVARYILAADAPPVPPVSLVESLGLSSLDVIELVTLLERHRDHPLPGLTVTPATSLAEVRAAVHDSGRATGRTPLPVRQPRWSAGPVGRILRRVTRPVLVGLWAGVSARITATPAPGAADFRGPCIVAVAPHRHWLDAFVAQTALPRGHRTLTVTNRDFAEYFAPAPGTPRRTRLAVGLAYHLLWPLVFPFVILPNFGSTREGMHELGRLIDRGITPMAFPKGLAPPGQPNPRHEPGIAVMAMQTGLPVVPVWLTGTDDLTVWPARHRPRISVRIGAPLPPAPDGSADELVARIEAAFTVLSGGDP